jgi:tetratricopeptide (TPR) repeat protein
VGARHDIQEGNKLYYDGKYDAAIKRYEEALKVDKDLFVGWFNLGLAHLALFSPASHTPANEAHAKAAIEALQNYLKLQPADTQARDYLLSLFIDSGHYEGAIAYFEAKLEKEPNSIDAVAQLAQINQQAGNYDAAIKWHKKKSEMVATNDLKADSWYSIGVLDWRRLYGHPDVAGPDRLRVADEGIGWLQKADEVRKNHAPTLSYLNLLYRERALSSEVWLARSVDTANALVYYKQATEAAKNK